MMIFPLPCNSSGCRPRVRSVSEFPHNGIASGELGNPMKPTNTVLAGTAFWAGLFLSTGPASPPAYVTAATALVGTFEQRWRDRAPCDIDAVFARCGDKISTQDLLNPNQRNRRLKRPVTYGPEIIAAMPKSSNGAGNARDDSNVRIWIRPNEPFRQGIERRVVGITAHREPDAAQECLFRPAKGTADPGLPRIVLLASLQDPLDPVLADDHARPVVEHRDHVRVGVVTFADMAATPRRRCVVGLLVSLVVDTGVGDRASVTAVSASPERLKKGGDPKTDGGKMGQSPVPVLGRFQSRHTARGSPPPPRGALGHDGRSSKHQPSSRWRMLITARAVPWPPRAVRMPRGTAPFRGRCPTLGPLEPLGRCVLDIHCNLRAKQRKPTRRCGKNESLRFQKRAPYRF
jgi:hypothetical protein